MTTTEPTAEEIRTAVRSRYADAARQVQVLQRASCCSTSSSSSSCCDTSASACCGTESQLYDARDLAEIPQGAALASLGCGNPTLLAQLAPGETVLDLGSGGGIDVLLSAKRVGATGKAYGLDMTDEMLELARANAREAGVENVEFLKGQIEAIPLPNASVDVIISNCVINLSADKDAVLREAHRVLRPGGRFAVADIVYQGQPPTADARRQMSLWAECVSGALGEREYLEKLAAVGFQGAEVQILAAYELSDDDLRQVGLTSETQYVSAFVKAEKPR